MRTTHAIIGGAAVAVAATCAFGTAASAATIDTPSGVMAGGNTTTVCAPELNEYNEHLIANAGGWNVFIGADGRVMGTPVASPAGKTFLQVAGSGLGDSDTPSVTAVASDGTVWAVNGLDLTWRQVGDYADTTSPSVSTAAGWNLWIQTNGAIGGTPVPSPAGKTFISVDGSTFGPDNLPAVTALASDGSVWSLNAADQTWRTWAHADSADPRVASAGGWDMFVGGGGAIGGISPTSPEGRTFVEIDGSSHGADDLPSVAALASDGTVWAINSTDQDWRQVGQWGNTTNPSVAAAGGWNVYVTNVGSILGAPVPSPAGTTFFEVTGGTAGTNSEPTVTALATDGTVWTISASSPTWAQVGAGASSTYSITGVTYDGVAATDVKATGYCATDVVPAHAKGPVDVVISSQRADGAAGPSYTLPQGYTYVEPADDPVIDPLVGAGGIALAVALVGGIAYKRRRSAALQF